MEEKNNVREDEKLVSYTWPDGMLEAARECYPDLPEEQAVAMLNGLVSSVTSM